ncbi:hypothetical protein CXB51_028233 [Gossypium anomalum]|uniref:HAT C-terminal dimerisation domain-containing protein n=1 Tax=Gossypium anomalum TaxID=47600 RepID=A0A8J5YIC2_9ROSI|nr:hypothetical protein CXB51_028233 [Gossypium anomalum]
MPPREEFPTKGLEVLKGGITRSKEHIAHKTSNVAPCPNVTGKQLEKVSNHNTSGIEGKNSGEVLVVGITFIKKGDLLMDQLENIMEKEQVNPSQTLRRKIGEAISKFLIYERLLFQLASSPWLYNLIQVSIEVGQGVKLPTPYEVSDVYLELEYQRVHDWLLLFKDKHETFGTPQAQRAWKQMNPAEWWIIYGTCVPKLQKLAIKVLSQTTSASNCERNWSTFSYIHTRARNRLKCKKLEKLVFTYYNMRLQIRHQKRMSIDDINTSFNPTGLDHIFEDVDPLLEWLHEKENPLLDGENVGVLLVDTSDNEMDVDQSKQQNLSHSSSSAMPSQS